MKIFVYAFSTLVVFALTVSIAISNSPVRIAIIDSPIDYDHPEIQAVLDEDLLQNVKLTDESGEEKTWYQLNLEGKAEFERRLDQHMYKDQIEFLDSMSSYRELTGIDERKRAAKRIIKGIWRYAISPKFRSQLKLAEIYIHGTHVAGVSIDSLSDIRLINFPIVQLPKPTKLSRILNFDPEVYRLAIRKSNEQIARALRESNVRVVNLSIGFSTEETLKKRAGIFSRLALNSIFRSKLREMVHAMTQVSREGFAEIARSNPQAVFVMAAGNSSKNVDSYNNHSAQINEPNVIHVASIEHSNTVSSFSNRSNSQIEIAAIGIAVEGSLVGGGTIYLSGNFMATPKVSNVLSRVFLANPSLSATEAIQVLYQKHTISDPKLANVVVGGRKLIERSPKPQGETLEMKIAYEAEVRSGRAATASCLKGLSDRAD